MLRQEWIFFADGHGNPRNRESPNFNIKALESAFEILKKTAQNGGFRAFLRVYKG